MNSRTLDQLKLEIFATLLRTKFKVGPGDANFVELELTEVKQTRSGHENDPRIPAQETCSLIFIGAENRFLPQGIYTFSHAAIGRFDLFIVPVGQKNGSYQYQVIFNRLVEQAQKI